jgi:ketosteroid isomerase-like protein
MTKVRMNPYYEKDDQHIVLKYFQLIDEKDMPGLLNLFSEDCMIYEPISRGPPSNEGKDKKPLKGRNEIESFFHVVMMASDGLKHDIDFACSSFEHKSEAGGAISSNPSSVLPAVVTFYSNEAGNKLKQKFVFHIVTEQNHNPLNKMPHCANDKNYSKNTRRIEKLCISTFND